MNIESKKYQKLISAVSDLVIGTDTEELGDVTEAELVTTIKVLNSLKERFGPEIQFAYDVQDIQVTV